MTVDALYEKLKADFGKSFDICLETFVTGKGDRALLVFVDGFINKDLLHRDILTPIKSEGFSGVVEREAKSIFLYAEDAEEFKKKVLNGFLGLYYAEKFYLFDIKQWEKRSIDIPDAENVTRGSKEGFTEDLITNTTLLRRKLKNEKLITENYKLGRQSDTNVIIAYIDGIVNKDVLDKVRERLVKIDVDGVFESGKIEQFIEENNLSALSGIGMTQKPDIAAVKILEGRVAIICEGTPHVLTIPELFVENIQTAEDYNQRIYFATFLRFLRLFGFVISIVLPGLSVAVLTFHQEMLPEAFLTSIIKSVQKTPFPEAVEIFFLMLMLELLKESGTRLPKTIGSAVSIVGALIIGDAAVSAGIVGAPSIIIVALTAISSFIIPNLNEFCTIYRFLILILGSLFGIVGIGLGLTFMLTSVSAKESFGVPVMQFFNKESLKDSVVRFPLRSLKYRPEAIAEENVRRLG